MANYQPVGINIEDGVKGDDSKSTTTKKTKHCSDLYMIDLSPCIIIEEILDISG